jgi:hypothetical protein
MQSLTPTKKDKAILRSLIDKGLQAEYEQALRDAGSILEKWHLNQLPTHDAYLKLYKKIQEHDKWIGTRYNGLTGSRYIMVVLGIYMDGLITDADLAELSEPVKSAIIMMKNR